MSHGKEEVKINNYSNWTSNEEPMHEIEFDGVSYEFIGFDTITPREAEIFKFAILAERERIWDESMDVDDDIMRRLLKIEKIEEQKPSICFG